MGHVVERSDFVDMLEESVTTRRPVSVLLRDGRRFEDVVREVVTQDGDDFAIFEQHAATPIRTISDCSRAQPWEPTYSGKRGQSAHRG
jgi:Rho-binding antiterminator